MKAVTGYAECRMIELDPPTEPLAALDRPLVIIDLLPSGKRNYMTKPLMTSFLVVMYEVLRQDIHRQRNLIPTVNHTELLQEVPSQATY
jgi:hypothetical protein